MALNPEVTPILVFSGTRLTTKDYIYIYPFNFFFNLRQSDKKEEKE